MIVRIGDPPSDAERWDPLAVIDDCRFLSYADLALAEIPPADRFEFYGLTESWPARIRIAADIEARVRESGAAVVNPPSALVSAETPAELARLLTPEVTIRPAVGAGGELPCRLRAPFGGLCHESDWLESEAEVDEILLDWVLSGTDPSLILRLSTPGRPTRRHHGVRLEDRLLLDGRFDDAAESELRTALDRTQRKMAAFEFWMEEGRPRIWRVDDGAATFWKNGLWRKDFSGPEGRSGPDRASPAP